MEFQTSKKELYFNSIKQLENKLIKAGFFTETDKKMKCFECGYQFDAINLRQDIDLCRFHHPGCSYILKCLTRKKFLSNVSLQYERERLQTFFDWPVDFISAEDLAKDGFYYLQDEDHCACIFCRGIIGYWEVGDTPRGEHSRHYPYCPFIRGQPVGNVPLELNDILDGLVLDGEEYPIPSSKFDAELKEHSIHIPPQFGKDGRVQQSIQISPTTNGIDVETINGFARHAEPRRRDYITVRERIKSYLKWPHRIKHTPQEMAEAGFFYCGISDHVRCFHCGNGLRNWRVDDIPWEEHAFWYPSCYFVKMCKGQTFVDKVRKKKEENGGTAHFPTVCSGRFKPLEDDVLESLMKLDIPKYLCQIFTDNDNIVKLTMRRRLETTGLPFFTYECGLDAVEKQLGWDTTYEDDTTRRGEDVTGHGGQNSTLQSISSNSSISSSHHQTDDEICISDLFSRHSPRKNVSTECSQIFERVDNNVNNQEREGKASENLLCKICFLHDMEIVFIPCSHMFTCSKCAVNFSQCPVCRQDIQYIMKPILS